MTSTTNKFVDCALAFGADYLVTNDRHFRVLKNISFPSLTVLRMEEFMEILPTLA
jgi:predicted nucleic acid-binding protein